jgi:drug/metabolite transporter (DMT)-like permease
VARSPKLGALAVAVLAFVWGYAWVLGKVALAYSAPFTFAALRTSIAALALFCVLVALRRPLRPPTFRYVVLIGLLQTTCFSGFSTLALAHSQAGKTSVLIYIMPFVLLFLAWVFLGERLHGLQWLAVAMAFPGLVLVIAPWHLKGLLPSMLTIAAGCAWAGSAILVKLLQQREQVDVLSLTTWQTIVGAVPLVVVALLMRETLPDWTAAFVVTLAYNALLANALGWLLWLFALRQLPAGAAGFGTLAVPVVGVVSAWLQLGERPGKVEIIGIALIVAALAIITLREVLRRNDGNRRLRAAKEEEAEELLQM